MSDSSRVGRMIQQARIRRAWSQAELARQLGVEYGQVGRWESGRDLPGPAQLGELYRMLEFSQEELDAIAEEAGGVIDTAAPVPPEDDLETTDVEPREADTPPVEVTNTSEQFDAQPLDDPEPDLPPPPPPSPVTGYRSTVGLAQILQVCFALLVVLGGLAVASSFVQLQLISRVIDDPASVSLDQITSTDDRQDVFAIAQLLGAFAVGIVFIVWTYRLYKNLEPLGAEREYAPGWAIGGWFVPFLNLVRPKQIVNEIWESSTPGGSPPGVSPLLHWWWGIWILNGVLLIFADSLDVGSLSEAERNSRIILASDLVWLVAAGLAFWVVRRVSSRQESFAAAMEDEAVATPQPLPVGARTDSRPAVAWLVGLPALGLVALVVGLAAWYSDGSGDTNEGNDRVESASDATGVFPTELEVGDCFNEPESTTGQSGVVEVMVIPRVACDQPHLAEVFAAFDYPPEEGDGYPDLADMELLISERCISEFQDSIDADYASSVLDVIYIGPGPDDWDRGDRIATCSAYRLDGVMMDAPISSEVSQDAPSTTSAPAATATPDPTAETQRESAPPSTVTQSGDLPKWLPGADLEVFEGDEFLVARWGPASGFTKASGYRHEYRISPGQASFAEATGWGPDNGVDTTGYRQIEELTNGETYEVAVRVCTDAGCTTPKTATATPNAPGANPSDFAEVGRGSCVRGDCIYVSSGLSEADPSCVGDSEANVETAIYGPFSRQVEVIWYVDGQANEGFTAIFPGSRGVHTACLEGVAPGAEIFVAVGAVESPKWRIP